MMKLVKTLLVILAAAAVIGFFYFLTLMSPGKSVKAPSEYIDPSVESSQLLKESEELEAEFESPLPPESSPRRKWTSCARR